MRSTLCPTTLRASGRPVMWTLFCKALVRACAQRGASALLVMYATLLASPASYLSHAERGVIC